jgi:ATP/maltotriose-dependent transcriptional regulator MalT
MRVLLVGRPDERERLRAEIDRTAFTIAGEFDTLAEARNADEEVDAILVGVGRTLRVRRARLKGSAHSEYAFEEPLTPREVEVLELLAEGLSNKAIAARLGISDQTVKFHVAAICGKLGAANRTDAVRRAIRRGLVSL